LATLHLYRLYQPRQALHYLRAREAFPRSVDVRFVDAALMATAYRDLSLTDSARVQLAVMDSLWPDVERIAPGNPENKVYHDDVLFMILCTEAAKTKQVNMDTLHRLFQDEVAFVEGGYKKYGWNPITVRIDYANALLANGQDREAEVVLKGGEHILANCIKCKYHAIEFYQLLVGILKARKDFAGAFHYQELNVKAKRELDIEARRTSVDQVLASLRFEQQRDSLTLVNQREQAAADAAVSRGKSQRDLLLIGGALALVIAALLWNRARLKRRLQVEQLRTRLSRDLHDDIGSTLSSINILSSVAQKRVEASGDSDAAIALSKISDRSQRLMRDMSDIVWSVDPKKDSLEDLVIRMREFGTTVMDPKGIDFTFSTSQNLPSALPVEVKNNLYLIFKEAMNNAAKHARATAVESRLSWEKQILRLEVSDNGTGLGPASDESGHGGNGLRNMRERAAEIKGELHVRSEPGKGLRITLLLPLR
ncbi:MAG: sensor histidine kinase, partial [Flavobacteriales bacterium]